MPDTTARPVALLLENIHPYAVELLSTAGFEVRTHPGAMDEAELAAALPGVSVLGIRSTTHVTREVLAGTDDLLAIGAFCIGTNQIDLAAATDRGVAVFNAPFSNTRSVVEIAVAEIISLARRLTERDDQMHAGVWDKSADGAHEVRGRTLGIVGYGNIGSQLSVVAEALGMRVMFYDTTEKLALGNARACASLDELLAEADTVTLHVDGRSGNAGMFGAAQFAAMRPRSIFLNLSRGFVVDYAALRRHIESGHIAGAAVDVFPDEPKRKGDPFHSELRGLRNVILTPHIAGSTAEAQQDIGRFTAAKLRDYAGAGTTTLSVNLPQVTMDPRPGTCRIAHLHHNVPGAMARVNQLLAERGVNIEGQLLSTRGAVGYALTDIGTAGGVAPAGVLAALAEVPETISTRLLAS
ncbi:phosphoglycerate dehydrogenase [Aquipuribacter nitratireducens]|uniref:D-3-phosphoglycerate dehydrogenase n=1 Tax=Aquipuribacter nitratireducens TaxID=650104 RepID=A0ABW0GLJ5_9MICO